MGTNIHFVLLSHLFFHRMRTVSDKSCRDNQKAHFLFCNFFFDNHAFYEIMWQNTAERDRPQMTIWRMRISCWTPKATYTHAQVV